jgi:hypothetical protein
VHDRNGKPPRTTDGPDAGTAQPDRRRIGRVVHDDRGVASVEWVDAPGKLAERPKLAIEDATPTASSERGYDPYGRPPAARGPTSGVSPNRPPARRDLRKLSEWIKKMRELEARKQRGEQDGED